MYLRYLHNQDIYQIKLERVCSSVTTTEIYAKFSLRRLEMDFPSLTNHDKKSEKSNIVHGKIVHTSDTHSIGQTISRVV